MAQRSLVSVGVLTTLTVILLLATIPVAGQAPTHVAPDLQASNGRNTSCKAA